MDKDNDLQADHKQGDDCPAPAGKKKWLMYLFFGLSVASVIVCAAGLCLELYSGRKGAEYYSALSAGIPRRAPQAPAAPTPPATGIPDKTDSGADDDNGKAGSADEFAANANTGPAGADYEPPWEPYVDFEGLKKEYPGIVGWILLEGTTLDYPIMQTTDNVYYLSYLPDGTKQKAGSIFLDYRNSPDFSDASSLVYGHESRLGEMFAVLKNYRQQAFYDNNPVISIYTPERDYDIALIAGYLLDSGVETPPLSFSDGAALLEHIDNIKSRSFFRSGVEFGPEDKMVNLCTCAYDFTNARLIITGKVIATS